MSQAAMIVLGLLIAFPLFYILGIFVFLAHVARKNEVTTRDILKYLVTKLTVKTTLKHIGIALFCAVVTSYFLTTDTNETILLHGLKVFDVTLLLFTVVLSVLSGNDNKGIFSSDFLLRYEQFSYGTAGNSKSSQTYGETSSNFDDDLNHAYMYDPAYSYMPTNIHNDDLKDWMNKTNDQ